MQRWDIGPAHFLQRLANAWIVQVLKPQVDVLCDDRGPCSAAAESPTTMKRTFRWSRARNKRSSFSLSGGAATDQGASTDETGNRDGLSWNAEASMAEEPGAGKPHAGIRAGAVG